MTNLTKSPISKLVEIIKKYEVVVPEIDKDQVKMERRTAMEEKKLKKKQEQIEHEKAVAKHLAKVDREKKRIAYWNEPKRAVQKRRYIEAFIKKYITMTEAQMEKNKQSNVGLKKETELLMIKIKGRGHKNVELNNIGQLTVNGVIISFGTEKPENNYTPEEYEAKIVELGGPEFADVIDAMYEKKLRYLEKREDGRMFIHHISGVTTPYNSGITLSVKCVTITSGSK